MKQLILDTLKICAVVGFFIGLACIVGTTETQYTREGVITDITGDRIEVEDETENFWSFVGNGYEVGQTVKCKMDNNGTDSTIADDKIISVKIIKKA